MSTLTAVLTRPIAINKSAERALIVALFSFLTFAGAMIRIQLPFTPVPITLQTLVLFMAVYFLDPKELGLSQLIYIAAGLIGTPVFAAGVAGMLALVGPTAGYLIGFIAAGIVMPLIKSKVKANYFIMAGIFTLGTLIVYTLGAAHLVLVYKMSIPQAVLAGMLPFVAGDAVKIAIASAFYKR